MASDRRTVIKIFGGICQYKNENNKSLDTVLVTSFMYTINVALFSTITYLLYLEKVQETNKKVC